MFPEPLDDFVEPRRKLGHISETVEYLQSLIHQGQGTIDLIFARRTIGILVGCRHKITPEQNSPGVSPARFEADS